MPPESHACEDGQNSVQDLHDPGAGDVRAAVRASQEKLWQSSTSWALWGCMSVGKSGYRRPEQVRGSSRYQLAACTFLLFVLPVKDTPV
jgi:hypothetical protein